MKDNREHLLEDFDTETLIIPDGCTPILQALDIGVNKVTRDKLKARFKNWISMRIEQLKDPNFSEKGIVSILKSIF
jgi:hypothetical protein